MQFRFCLVKFRRAHSDPRQRRAKSDRCRQGLVRESCPRAANSPFLCDIATERIAMPLYQFKGVQLQLVGLLIPLHFEEIS